MAAIYKTSLCRHFERLRKCKMGDACGFAHGEEELRRVETLTPTLTPDAKNYKTSLCRHFAEKGFCHLGDSCGFAHGADDLKKFKYGPCRFGLWCRETKCVFEHPEGFKAFQFWDTFGAAMQGGPVQQLDSKIASVVDGLDVSSASQKGKAFDCGPRIIPSGSPFASRKVSANTACEAEVGLKTSDELAAVAAGAPKVIASGSPFGRGEDSMITEVGPETSDEPPSEYAREVFLESLYEEVRDDLQTSFGDVEDIEEISRQKKGYVRFREHSAAAACVEAKIAVWSIRASAQELATMPPGKCQRLASTSPPSRRGPPTSTLGVKPLLPIAKASIKEHPTAKAGVKPLPSIAKAAVKPRPSKRQDF